MNSQNELEQLKAKCKDLEKQLDLVKSAVTHKSYNLGDKFYDTISEHLNNSLKADYTFIGRLTDKHSIKTIALYGSGKILENIEYDLNFTPCENVVGNTVCSYADNVCDLFPKDVLLKEMEIKGYIGVPLFDSNNEPNGILVSLYKKPIADTSMAELLLFIFASQAGAEIEYNNTIARLNASQNHVNRQNEELSALEEELRQTNKELFNTNELLINNEQEISIQNNRLSNLINHLPDGVLIETHDGSVSRVNKKLCELLEINVPPATLIGANMIQLLQSGQTLFLEEDKLIVHTQKIAQQTTPLFNEDIDLKNGKTLQRSYIPVETFDGGLEKIWVYRDVTEEKINAKRVVNSEKRLSSYIEHAPNGIFVTNDKGNYIDVNPAAEALSGYSRHELLSMNILDLVIPQHTEDTLAAFSELNTKGQVSIEQAIVCKDKTIRIWFIDAVKIGDNRMLGFVSDITAKQKDKALNEARIRLLNFSINHTVNEVLVKFLDEAEILTQSKIGFYHFLEEDQETVTLQAWSSNTTETMCNAEGTGMHYNISEAGVWVDCVREKRAVVHNNYALLKHKKGLPNGHAPILRQLVVPVFRNDKIVAILGVGNKDSDYQQSDIEIIKRFADFAWETVSRKQAEEVTLEERNRANNILEGTNAGTWDWDIQSNKLIINRRWAEIIGYTLNELSPITANTWIDSVHPDDFSGADKKLKQHFNREIDYFDAEFRQRHKDEHWVWIHARGKVIEWTNDQKPLRMYGTHIDITERKKAELQLKENQKQLQLIFDNSPATMLLIDKNANIIKANRTGLNLAGQSTIEASNLQPGDFLKCITALNAPGGCGSSPSCNLCNVRNTILDTIKNSEENIKKEAQLTLIKNGKSQKHHILISSTVASDSNNKTYLVTIDDITEQELAALKIKKSEERFKDFANSITDIYFALDRELKYIFWNKACEELIGYLAKEIIGRSFYDLEINKGFEWVAEKYKNAIKTGETESFEAVYKKDEDELSLWINAYPTKEGVLVYVKNITERKKAEKELEQSVMKFKTLADYTYDWEYWRAPDGTYMYISPSCERISGYSAREFIETPTLFDSIVIQADKKWEQHLKDANDHIACERPIEIQIKNKQGKTKWINHVCRPVYDTKGNYIGNRGTNRDITLQKLSQLAMEQSQLRFRQLADLAFEGMIIHRNAVAQDMNRAFLNMTGYKVDELFGKDLIKFLFPEKYHAILYNRLSNYNPRCLEVELIKKGGDIIWVEVNGKIISENEPNIRVTSFRDISDQKYMQQTILQTVIKTEEQERKRIAQELHDGLGPVLSTIKLYTETYINSTNETFKEKIKTQLLSGIEDALEQTSAISNNLSPHVLNDFGIKVAIQKFIEKVLTISNAKVEFEFDYLPELNRDLEITLYRIAIELMNNSLKHAEPTIITLSITGDENEVLMEYTDDGVGFDFNETKRQRKGMGLFNIVNRIQSLNGSIQFERRKKGIKYIASAPNKPSNINTPSASI